jgi:hypothetical protein
LLLEVVVVELEQQEPVEEVVAELVVIELDVFQFVEQQHIQLQ